MKRILVLMLILSLALMFIGCSDDDKDDEKMTQLSFKNLTNAELTITLNGVKEIIQVDAGETSTYNFDNEIFVDGDEIMIDYDVSGIYVATQARTATIKKGEKTTAEIIAEGGVISFTNNFDKAVEDLRIYTGSEYGFNLIAEPLAKGETFVTLKNPDTYNIRLKLENNETDDIFDIVVTDNEMNEVIYFKKVFVLENKTSADIRYKLDNESNITLIAGERISRTLGDEFGDEVELSYSGLYIIAQTLTLDYTANSYYEFELEAQLGALYVKNNTTDNITEVYLTQNIANWGPDYISGHIAPGARYGWPVVPGLWNVKIVDDAGYQAISENIQVDVDNTVTVEYGDDKSITLNYNTPQYEINNTPISNVTVETNK